MTNKKENEKMTYAITRNNQFNSIEISFDGKPSEAIRSALKDLRFRWHSVKKVWYGYATEEQAKAAIEGKAAPMKAEQKTKKAEAVNEFGVKVGDLFYASWGYEQTNVNFFQIVALVGKNSVRVREVNPPIIEDEAYSHGMAADRVYKTKGLPILPATSSVFIKDDEKGDLKRLKSFAADGKSDPLFTLSSYANAHYCGSETQKLYESWYY